MKLKLKTVRRSLLLEGPTAAVRDHVSTSRVDLFALDVTLTGRLFRRGNRLSCAKRRDVQSAAPAARGSDRRCQIEAQNSVMTASVQK